MERFVASLTFFTCIVLSACSSSSTDAVYAQSGDQVVIDAEIWSSTIDAAELAWTDSKVDGNTIAKLTNRRHDSEPLSDTLFASATYDITFEDTGIFYLWVRARLSGINKNPDHLTISLANATGQKQQSVANFSDEWQWVSVDENHNVLSINVPARRTYQISIATANTDLLLDRIILSRQPDFIPMGIGPESTIIRPITDTDNIDTPAISADETTGNISNPDEIPGDESQIDENEGKDTESPAPESTPTANEPSGNGSVTDANQADKPNQQPEVIVLNSLDPADSVATIGQPLQLHADATDDGLPSQALYTYWTKVAGPGEVTFSDRTAASPTVSFGATGTYTLQVSANDTELYKNATLTVEVLDQITTPVSNDTTAGNQPPVVSIDGSTSVSVGQTLVLTAVTSDDGLPNGMVFHYWNLVHGSSSATFKDIKTQSTSVTFSEPGSYTVQVSASDSADYSNATIKITVDGAANNAGDESDTESGNSSSTNDDLHNTAYPGNRWHQVSAQGSATKRHEAGGVAVDGKLYVIGGRGKKPVDVYDPASNTWTQASSPPLEMHHFQAVAIDRVIYIVGAATCCYPVEKNIGHVYQFDTRSGKWSKGAAIPAHRQRGSAAAAVYNNKIYLVGGNTKGHSGGAVHWFDEFDPATGNWKTLADAPDARDHASLAIIGDQLIIAGGRRSAHPNTFGDTVAQTNIYDFKQQRWQRAANIPTQRAGTMAVSVGQDYVVIGGESGNSKAAHSAVEAFNTAQGQWRTLSALPTPRHGGAASVINNEIHVVAGSMQRGGAPETDVHEILR